MSDLFDRAMALRELLDSGRHFRRELPVEDAVASCCADLMEAGEPQLALDLLDRASQFGFSDRERELRFAVLRVRALRIAGLYEDGLAYADSVLDTLSDVESAPAVLVQLIRVAHAACLWQLNRVDAAVQRLSSIRSELMSKPDSEATARCALELSSAEIFRGRLDSGREHAMEAIVSARRCRDRYAESVALGNLGRIEKFLCRWAQRY